MFTWLRKIFSVSPNIIITEMSPDLALHISSPYFTNPNSYLIVSNICYIHTSLKIKCIYLFRWDQGGQGTTVHTWRSKDPLGSSALFYHVDPGDPVQVIMQDGMAFTHWAILQILRTNFIKMLLIPCTVQFISLNCTVYWVLLAWVEGHDYNHNQLTIFSSP